MNKLLTEQIVPILIVLALFFGGGWGTYTFWDQYNSINSEKVSKKQELQVKIDTLAELEAKKKASEVKKDKKEKTTSSGKIIYEVSGQQFTPEASFGFMFENLLANITNSGVRIRSIDYNYQPQEDRLLSASPNGGFNACEISFVTVGNYAQFQHFFKNITREEYLSGIQEIYIEPYDKDKTILITRFKIRLYTKTI